MSEEQQGKPQATAVMAAPPAISPERSQPPSRPSRWLLGLLVFILGMLVALAVAIPTLIFGRATQSSGGNSTLPSLPQIDWDTWGPVLLEAGAILGIFLFGILLIRRIRWHVWSRDPEELDGPKLQADIPRRGPVAGEKDPLHYRRFAKVIARTIKRSAAHSPLAISIEGEWGTGKTTVMHMIEEQLKQKGVFRHNGQRWECHTVWFDAWKYRGTDIKKGFLSSVFKAIPDTPLHKFFGVPPISQAFLAGLDMVGRMTQGKDTGSRVADRLDIQARYRNQFEEDFRNMLTYWATLYEQRRPLIVIFIDDLDRCTPTEVARVLEMMKLFFDAPGCVFVLGFDPRIVAKSIERDYSGVVSDGLVYLKKIIQASYPLPQAVDEDLAHLIEDAIKTSKLGTFFTVLEEQMKQMVQSEEASSGRAREARVGPRYLDLIIKGTGRNPREIKRFVNALAISSQLSKDHQEEQHYFALCMLLLLQIRWPRCYLDVVRRARQGKRQLTQLLDDIVVNLPLLEPVLQASEADQRQADAALQRMPWLLDEELQVFLSEYPLRVQEESLRHVVNKHGLSVVAEAIISQDTAPAEVPVEVRRGQAVVMLQPVPVTPSWQVVQMSALESPTTEPQGPPADALLRQLPDPFVGRKEDLAWLLERLHAQAKGEVLTLTGLGGIGKTALAAVAVQRVQEERRFPDGIAVIPCAGKKLAAEALGTVLTRFDTYRRSPDATDLEALQLAAQRLLNGKRALIVLDNVEPELAISDVVTPLRAAGATLLLTARQALTTATIPHSSTRVLELLPPDEALELFARSFGRESAGKLTQDERSAAENIVRALEYHTLAVKLAGAYALNASRDLLILANELKNPQRALDLSYDDSPEGVRRAFAPSVRELPWDAQRLFTALAAFAVTEFGRQAVIALAEGMEVRHAMDQVDLLTKRSLIEANPNTDMPEGSDRERIHLHLLLRAYIERQYAQWSKEEHHQAALTIARYYASYVAQTFMTGIDADEANIMASLKWIAEHGEDQMLMQLCEGMSRFWLDRGRSGNAVRFLPQAIAAAERLIAATHDDADRRSRANLIQAFGQIEQRRGNLDHAGALFEENLKFRRDIHDQPGEAYALYSLGQISRYRGQLDDARTYYQQALDLARKGKDRQGEGIALGRLGQIFLARSELDAAEDYFRQALQIARELGDWVEQGIVTSRLGMVAFSRGKFEEAKRLHQQALQIAQTVRDRLGEGIAYSRLGKISFIGKDFDEAERFLKLSLKIDREVLDRRGEGVDLLQLGRVALDRDDFRTARERFDEARQIAAEVDDRRTVGVAVALLGLTALNEGDLAEAERCYTQALDIARDVQNRRGEMVDLNQLAYFAEQRGQVDEAERLYRQGLAVAREIAANPDTPNILLAFGRFLIERRNQRDEGCSLITEAVRLYTDMKLPREAAARQIAGGLGCN